MAKRGRPAEPAEEWYRDVAKLMVREDMGFSQACQALGIKFASGKVEEVHQNRKAFQDIYWDQKFAFFEDIGGNTGLTKTFVLGQLAHSIKRLGEKGEDDKIATAAYTLAKIAGWLQPETVSTVFANLSQADLDQIKERVKAKIGTSDEERLQVIPHGRDLPS